MRTYEVEISFCGFIGCTNLYEVEAENEDDAQVLALEMAMDDLVVENVEKVKEEED